MNAPSLSIGPAAWNNYNSIKSIAAKSEEETPTHKKLRRAAQEFEGLLIEELWKEAGSDFSTLTGERPSAEAETMNSLAIQTMSVALAQKGGLGIAQMLVRQLEPSLDRNEKNRGGGKIKGASSA